MNTIDVNNLTSINSSKISKELESSEFWVFIPFVFYATYLIVSLLINFFLNNG